ncbi:MAG: hypothetical protein WC890_01990 [Candidatus Margulisiibacteriota bacterium]
MPVGCIASFVGNQTVFQNPAFTQLDSCASSNSITSLLCPVISFFPGERLADNYACRIESFSSEEDIFSRIGQTQNLSSAIGKEFYGYYDSNYTLVVINSPSSSSQGIDFVDKPAGTIPFHTHLSIPFGSKIDQFHADYAINLDDIPSEADIVAFLSSQTNEEIICTEKFFIRMKKTKQALPTQEFIKQFGVFQQANPRVTSLLSSPDIKMLEFVFVQYYISKYFRGTSEAYRYYNSNSFIDICHDIFGIEIQIYNRNSELLPAEEINKSFFSAPMTIEERNNILGNYNSLTLPLIKAFIDAALPQ